MDTRKKSAQKLKLSLSKETLRRLSEKELEKPAGGATQGGCGGTARDLSKRC